MTSLRLCLAATVCALALLIASPAQATIMQYLEVEDLARHSTDIFHGQIISSGTHWNPQRTRIYTAARLRVSESFKGAARRDSVVTITQLGGEKDGVRMDYAGRPEFRAGESVVLFTTRTHDDNLTVVALKQGKMTVEGTEIKRDFSGLTLVDSLAGGKAARPIAVKPTRLTLDELRNRISKTR